MSNFESSVAEHERAVLTRPDPIVRADAVEYVVFERRDLAAMRRFLADFGFTPVAHDGDIAYFRGYDPAPYRVAVIPSTHDRLVGFAFAAANRADLDRFAQATGAAIESAEGPGGGSRVRVTDPDGLQVDLVYGTMPAPSLPTRTTPIPVNTPMAKGRMNTGVRTPVEPSPIFRLGHVVLQRTDFDGAAQWYMRHFGLIPSDVLVLPDGRPNLAFFRLDRGMEPADHHSMAILGGPAPGLMHVSFETLDVESVGQGQQFLRARGWTHYWGIGRHVLGSQVFDYWKDPAGDEWEHYADGDVLDADQPTHYHRLDRGGLWAWGDDLPDSLRPKFSIRQMWAMIRAGRSGKLDMSRMKGLRQALTIKPREWMR